MVACFQSKVIPPLVVVSQLWVVDKEKLCLYYWLLLLWLLSNGLVGGLRAIQFNTKHKGT